MNRYKEINFGNSSINPGKIGALKYQKRMVILFSATILTTEIGKVFFYYSFYSIYKHDASVISESEND